jgi:ketosteroid isomerase-like protein
MRKERGGRIHALMIELQTCLVGPCRDRRERGIADHAARRPEAARDVGVDAEGRDWTTFAATPQQFVAEGASVIALGRYTGQHKESGRRLDAAFAHHWTIEAGKITGFVQYTDTAKVLDAMCA